MKRKPTKNMQRALQWLRDHGFMGPDEDFITSEVIRTEFKGERTNQRTS